MNLICWLFGHKPPSYMAGKGWGGWDYCDLGSPYTDGIGRRHVSIQGHCARCERKFEVGMAHLPKETPPTSEGEK